MKFQKISKLKKKDIKKKNEKISVSGKKRKNKKCKNKYKSLNEEQKNQKKSEISINDTNEVSLGKGKIINSSKRQSVQNIQSGICKKPKLDNQVSTFEKTSSKNKKTNTLKPKKLSSDKNYVIQKLEITCLNKNSLENNEPKKTLKGKIINERLTKEVVESSKKSYKINNSHENKAFKSNRLDKDKLKQILNEDHVKKKEKTQKSATNDVTNNFDESKKKNHNLKMKDDNLKKRMMEKLESAR